MKYADWCDLQPSHVELSIHVSNLFSIQWCNFLRLTTNLLSWKKSKHVERWPFWKVGEIFAIASLAYVDCSLNAHFLVFYFSLGLTLAAIKSVTNQQSMETISTDEINLRLKEFKSWISNQHDLPQNTEEILLLRFLKVAKWRVEKAQRFFRHSIQMRTSHPLIFTQRDPMSQNIQKVFDVMWVVRQRLNIVKCWENFIFFSLIWIS